VTKADRIAEYLRSLPPEDVPYAIQRLKQDEFRTDLFSLCHYLGFKDVTWNTHGQTISILEAPSKRKLIVVPRGTLKSTIGCVAFPIQKLIQDPNHRILLDSELYTNSKNFIREITGHLMDPKLTSLYGTFYNKKNWNEGEITIKQRTKVYKEASITAGGIGTTKVGQHYTIIIGDDYNSDKNSQTPEGRKKVIDHFRYNMSILEPGGTYVVIATRYAEDDVPGFILQNIMGQKEISYGTILSDVTKFTSQTG
jgi:hypothetical protein